MSALEELYLVLAAIYLADCLVWVRTQSSVFTKRWRTYRRADGGALWGNAQAGLNLAWPLPPLGCVFVSEPLPLALAAEGVCNPSTRRLASWEETRRVELHGRELRLGREVLASTSSARATAQLAEELWRLASLAQAERERALDALAEQRFDAATIPARLERMRPERARLLPLANALFVYAFVALPLVIEYVGLVPTLLWTASGLLALQAATVLTFARAQARLFPGATGENRGAWLSIALSPPGAMRSADLLSRDFLADRDPLALAAVLLPREDFERCAAERLRAARHVSPPGELAPDAARVLAAARARELRALEALLRRCGLDPERLDAPPERLGEDCLAYCPRCRAQYLHSSGTCEPCSGVALRAFELPR